MKIPNHLNEDALESLLEQQKRMAWDAFDCVDWSQGVDFNKPFLPLDKKNIAFPDVTKEERLVISQYMGMMIAAVFSEMELAMDRMKDVCWRPLMKRYATNPELINLGEEFFKEENKHAHVFQRFLDICAQELDVDPKTLKDTLPRLQPGYIETILRHNSFLDGVSMWWIVATVEEESQMIYKLMHPHKGKLDPLYYAIHRRHFEEEARHAPYAFIMLDMGSQKGKLWQQWLRKTDFLVSEILKSFWLFFELSKSVDVSHLKSHHKFFESVHTLIPKLKEQSLFSIFSSFLKDAPYISAFINPLFHPYLKKEIAKHKVFKLPLPKPGEIELYV